jgi:multisubunit Na+/H+ antiporter MnhF subunit
VIGAAQLLLLVGGAGFTWRIVRGPTVADRLVAVDGLVTTLVAYVMVAAVAGSTDRFLGVGLVIAFVGFLGTSAGARFIERRGGGA